MTPFVCKRRDRGGRPAERDCQVQAVVHGAGVERGGGYV